MKQYLQTNQKSPYYRPPFISEGKMQVSLLFQKRRPPLLYSDTPMAEICLNYFTTKVASSPYISSRLRNKNSTLRSYAVTSMIYLLFIPSLPPSSVVRTLPSVLSSHRPPALSAVSCTPIPRVLRILLPFRFVLRSSRLCLVKESFV